MPAAFRAGAATTDITPDRPLPNYNGSLLEPIPPGTLADVLIADVSGIAEIPARILGWYPSSIPSGGTDGTDTTIQVLDQAVTYLAEGGRLYFPVAVGLAHP